MANEDLERRTLDELDRLPDLDTVARFISKHLMMVEIALDKRMVPGLEALRSGNEDPSLALGYLDALQGYHLIRAGHMSLTKGDTRCFGRPVPASR